MSKKRLVSSLAAMSCVLAVAARFVVIQFPMLAPAQPTVLKSGGTLLHRAPVEYPAAAIEKGIAGAVVVQATVNDKGAVEDARVLSGPEALRRAALKSVLDWHYEDQRNSSVEVAIDFVLPRNDDKAAEPKTGGKLQRIEFAGVPRAMQNAVLARNTLREGQAIDAGMEKSFENLVR